VSIDPSALTYYCFHGAFKKTYRYMRTWTQPTLAAMLPTTPRSLRAGACGGFNALAQNFCSCRRYNGAWLSSASPNVFKYHVKQHGM